MGDNISKVAYYEKLEQLRKTNFNVSAAYDYFDHMGYVTSEAIDKFLDNLTLTPEEFIYFIALRRKHADGEDSGGGNDAALEFILEDYRNTPWKFVEEFLQNADDCFYEETPEIEITVNVAEKKIEFSYNEIGFSPRDIWALTHFKKSNKLENSNKNYDVSSNAEGLFYNEKTGRKGIGFKSVFALPADNIIVHIRSNGYSFMLNKRINTIVPIWEEGYEDDGKTHVTVEFESPQFDFKLEDIYPRLREQFCIDKVDELFSNSPILFMHRLRGVRVNNIIGTKCESFETSVQEVKKSFLFGPFINDRCNVLSAVCSDGRISKSLWCELEIQLKDSNGLSVHVPAVRYSESRKISGFWRLFSVISPILQEGIPEWKKGSLFRTFPTEFHQYNIPFSMDIPFELDSSRKGVNYTKDLKSFNEKIYNEAFGTENSIFSNFLLLLRTVQGIEIDRYFCSDGAVLFDTEYNSCEGKRVIPVFDMEKRMESMPLFPRFNNENTYISYEKLICVDSDLLYWPHNEYLLSLLLGEKREYLVSEKYMNCEFLYSKRNSVINVQFINSVNMYLDKEEKEQRIGNGFISILENNLYPFLRKNKSHAIRVGAFKQLKMFCMQIYGTDGNRVVRECFNEGLRWINNTDKFSIEKYRTMSSSIVPLDFIKDIIMDEFSIVSVRDEFSDIRIQTIVNSMGTWEELFPYLKAVFYYGYSINRISIPILDNCAVSESIDPIYNPFRDANQVYIITAEDIQQLALISNSDSSSIVNLLKKSGLRDGSDFFNQQGGFLALKDVTINLLRCLSGDSLEKCLKRIGELLLQSGKKLDLNYSSVSSCDLSVVLFFLRNKELIATESYHNICEQCFRDERIWMKKTNLSSEILLRSANSFYSRDNNNQITYIELEYLISHKLLSLYKRVTEKKGFGEFISINNNGLFTELPTYEVLSLIGIFAEDELETKKDYKFYGGDFSLNGTIKTMFLIDNVSKSVFLHIDDNYDYKESLIQYLNISKDIDSEKIRYFYELDKKTKKVYLSVIRPVLERIGQDGLRINLAYTEIEEYLDTFNKQDIINIIAWFRANAYGTSVGGAARSHEKEIEDDYEAEPWRFVYEFLQNVDDCIFEANTIPELSININENNNSISFDYNELGFTLEDIKALTSFGSSSKSYSLEKNTVKSGTFDLEKTGRKGRGFKSVFALPGNDIVVHIYSNGFTFKFIKRFGEIIPIWEDVNNAPVTGTRIVVEGFQGDSIHGIYESLLNILCAGERENFFAKSPLLYLRKLKSVSISNGVKNYKIGMIVTEEHFSKEEFHLGNLRLVSGIINEGKYYKSLYSKIELIIKMTGKEDLHINSIRLSLMEEVVGEARLITFTSPVICENDKDVFVGGALYRTFPLNENVFRIPIAINAPYVVNSGRSAIVYGYNKINNRINQVVFGEAFSEFYSIIREIPNIAIDQYIYEKDTKNSSLFDNNSFVETVNLEMITRSQPILRLYSQKGFVSCNQARVLIHDCYKWYQPAMLAAIFTDNKYDYLVEEKYTSRRIGASRINMVNVEFHQHINSYIAYCIQYNPDNIWNILQIMILPFISSVYDRLMSAYHADSKDELLKQMKVFAYTDYKGNYRLESAQDGIIWMKNCPNRFNSFGVFRVLSTAPVRYTDEMLGWMSRIINIQDFSEVFKEENIKLDSINSWDELKKWIEMLIYYHISPRFKVAYLKRCALSKVLSPIKNLFREAFLESSDSEILDHCIEQSDIDSILSDMGGYSETTQEEIIELLRQMGLKQEDDYFDIERGIARFNKETIALFKSHCKDADSSAECVNSISDKYWKLVNNKQIRDVHISYEELKHCKPIFISSLFKKNFMKYGTADKFAEEVYSDSSALIKNVDYVEMILVALSFLDNNNDTKHKLSINLSEILERKIASFVKKAMIKGCGVNLSLVINRDIPVNSYESKEVKKSLSWLQSSDNDDISDINKYEYYTASIKEGFDKKDDLGFFVYDSNSVILDIDDVSTNLLEFVRAKYSSNTDGDLFSGLIKIVSIQNELTGGWNKSKKEYINRLAEFREETQKYIDFLCPDYQRNINLATGKVEEFLIPELLQNINDCKKKNGEKRDLHITIKDKVMILQYSEAGFEYSDVYSITAYGQSTKHDEREGEKGLGFKKVFAVFPSVEIYSNGFCFSLFKEKATIPYWIEDESKQAKYQRDGYTTMVFRAGTLQVGSINKIAQIWETAVTKPEKAGLLLALQNIDQYTFSYSKGVFHLSREELLDNYYQAEVPLLALYRKLLEKNQPVSIVNDKIHAIKAELKKRKKCSVMSEDEFEKYVTSLPMSVYIPKKKENVKSGVLYSTLPTSRTIGASFYINMPIELSTGRNEILDESAFNKAIWKIVFERDGSSYSVMNYLLCNIVARCSDLDLYKYFNGNIDDYIDLISAGNEERAALFRKEIDCIPIFRSYPDGKPVALCSAFTAQDIVYEYLYSDVEKKTNYVQWVNQTYLNGNHMSLLTLKKHSSDEIEELNQLASSIGEDEHRFPITIGDAYMEITYFEKEYGIGGRDE